MTLHFQSHGLSFDDSDLLPSGLVAVDGIGSLGCIARIKRY
jgi:hypothetical protein